jgi:hypothetical protein
VSGQLHAPGALPPGKEPPVPIGQEVGWAPEPVWVTWRRENSWSYRDWKSDLSAIQPVTSRYTYWAIPAHVCGPYNAVFGGNYKSVEIIIKGIFSCHNASQEMTQRSLWTRISPTDCRMLCKHCRTLLLNMHPTYHKNDECAGAGFISWRVPVHTFAAEGHSARHIASHSSPF